MHSHDSQDYVEHVPRKMVYCLPCEAEIEHHPGEGFCAICLEVAQAREEDRKKREAYVARRRRDELERAKLSMRRKPLSKYKLHD